MTNIIAVDYGKKRTGLAWLQPGLDIILPYGIIEAKNDAERLEKISALIKEEMITKIVLGLPLSEDGSENENTIGVRNFGDMIQADSKIEIEFIDERYSSRAADQMGGDASRDEKAAMVILQSYVDQVGV